MENYESYLHWSDREKFSIDTCSFRDGAARIRGREGNGVQMDFITDWELFCSEGRNNVERELPAAVLSNFGPATQFYSNWYPCHGKSTCDLISG